MDTFGANLNSYRRRCTDPASGGKLTQQRLADLLHEYDDRFPYTKAQISQWENGRRVIPHDQRDLLVGLIYVLTTCNGIKKREEADGLLTSGGYAPLSQDEVNRIPDKKLYENEADPPDLLTISGILDTLKKLMEDKDNLLDDKENLIKRLNQIEDKRIEAITGMSHTQRAVLGAIPSAPTPLDDVFSLVYKEVPSLEGIRIKEIMMRLHELRYLGLIDRKKDPKYRWIYWREPHKTFRV